MLSKILYCTPVLFAAVFCPLPSPPPPAGETAANILGVAYIYTKFLPDRLPPQESSHQPSAGFLPLSRARWSPVGTIADRADRRGRESPHRWQDSICSNRNFLGFLSGPYLRAPEHNYPLRHLHHPALDEPNRETASSFAPQIFPDAPDWQLPPPLLLLDFPDRCGVGPNGQSDFGLIIIAEKMTPISASNICVILSRSHCLGVG